MSPKIKALESKKNFLQGKIDSIKNSGLFSEEEIEKLIKPMQTRIPQINEDINSQRIKDLVVVDAEELTETPR